MYEHRSAPLLPRRLYVLRLVRSTWHATAIVVISLALGTLGFWALAEQEPIDALLNAAMLLGGMGPVGEIRSTPGKLFAAGFALYAGLVFLVAGAMVLGPALHRLLHRFHVEREGRG